jgi:hypothetical protein
MADINSIIRRSVMIDTSGSQAPAGIQSVPVQSAGVYTQLTDSLGSVDVVNGRISLGILGAFILGALVFYIWTHDVQGGG